MATAPCNPAIEQFMQNRHVRLFPFAVREFWASANKTGVRQHIDLSRPLGQVKFVNRFERARTGNHHLVVVRDLNLLEVFWGLGRKVHTEQFHEFKQITARFALSAAEKAAQRISSVQASYRPPRSRNAFSVANSSGWSERSQGQVIKSSMSVRHSVAAKSGASLMCNNAPNRSNVQ
jgi:hypothetical protein